MRAILKGITGKDLRRKNNFVVLYSVYNMLISVNIYE
jgi:hypothetical protein